MTLISLLISLLIIIAVVYIVSLILNALALPQPWNRIIYVILGLIILLWLLRTLGLY